MEPLPCPSILLSSKTVLYSAVLSDTLDGLGHMNQAMRPFIRPLDETLVMFGRARTGPLHADLFGCRGRESL